MSRAFFACFVALMVMLGLSATASARTLSGIDVIGTSVVEGTKVVKLRIQKDAGAYASAQDVADAYGTNITSIRELNLGRTLAGCKMGGGRISRPQIPVPPPATVERVYQLRSSNGLWTDCANDASKQVLMLIAGEVLTIHAGKTALTIGERVKIGNDFLACNGDTNCLQQVASKNGAKPSATKPVQPVVPPPPPAVTPDEPPQASPPPASPADVSNEVGVLKIQLANMTAERDFADKAFWGACLLMLGIFTVCVVLVRRKDKQIAVLDKDRESAVQEALEHSAEMHQRDSEAADRSHVEAMDALREKNEVAIVQLTIAHAAEVTRLKREHAAETQGLRDTSDDRMHELMGIERVRLQTDILALEGTVRTLEESQRKDQETIQELQREQNGSDRDLLLTVLTGTLDEIYKRFFGISIPGDLKGVNMILDDLQGRMEVVQSDVVNTISQLGLVVENAGPRTMRDAFDLTRLREITQQLTDVNDQLKPIVGEPDESLLERLQVAISELQMLRRRSMAPVASTEHQLDAPPPISSHSNGTPLPLPPEHDSDRPRGNTLSMPTLRPSWLPPEDRTDMRSPEHIQAFDGLKSWNDYMASRALTVIDESNDLDELVRTAHICRSRSFQCLSAHGTIEQFTLNRLDEPYRKNLFTSAPALG